jgi:hypothetical protein
MRLDLVAEKARKVNPNVLIVNRGGGVFEDYSTPVSNMMKTLSLTFRNS